MAARTTGSQSKGKKGRKIGRMKKKPSHIRYNSEKRALKNKAKRIVRYMKKHPNWKLNNISDEMMIFIRKYSN